jgi:hypothetical protein
MCPHPRQLRVACFRLVPKLCLGMSFAKLRFANLQAHTGWYEAELRGMRSQAELGNEVGVIARELPFHRDGQSISWL